MRTTFILSLVLFALVSYRDFFAYWDPDIGLSGVFDGIGLVKGLSIRKPSTVKTAGGVGIGSTLRRVEEELGIAERVKEGGEVHWYWKKGIEFMVNSKNK